MAVASKPVARGGKIRDIARLARRRRGVLTLEWILLVTVIVIGVIGGLGAVRTATIGELTDLAEAITHLNVKTSAEVLAEGEAAVRVVRITWQPERGPVRASHDRQLVRLRAKAGKAEAVLDLPVHLQK